MLDTPLTLRDHPASGREVAVVKIGGAEIHVQEKGAGRPVLFLHGNPDTGDMWSGVIGRMGDGFRCIAPDLPGFGRSGVPVSFDCSLDGLARFVGEFVDSAGLVEPLDMVGHDFGGTFALAWAIKNPTRVRRIGILNTNFFSDYRWHIWARIWRTPVLGELSMALMNRATFIQQMRRDSPGLSEAHLRDTYARITPTMKRMVLRLYRATDSANYAAWEPGLKDLMGRVPACVLWGDGDPYIEPRFADRFGAREVHHFAQHGHFLPVEAPEEVAQRLKAFLG